MRARRLVWLALVVVVMFVLVLAPASVSAASSAPARTDRSAQTVADQDIGVETVVRDLATIWAVDFAPDGRIFLTERGGRIRTITNGTLDPEPWATIEVV